MKALLVAAFSVLGLAACAGTGGSPAANATEIAFTLDKVPT